MDAEEKAKLKKLLALMKTFGEETGHGDISLHQLKVLLLIAVRDADAAPIDSREIAKNLGLSTSGVSRAIASLGDHGRGARKGLGLVEAREDPMDRRRKPVQLSRKGLRCIEKVLQAVEPV